MIAVPAALSSTIVNGINTSISINKDGYLPDGSLFFSVYVTCDELNQRSVNVAIRRFDAANLEVEQSQITSASLNASNIKTAGGTLALSLTDGINNEVFKIENIKESIAAGVSAPQGLRA